MTRSRRCRDERDRCHDGCARRSARRGSHLLYDSVQWAFSVPGDYSRVYGRAVALAALRVGMPGPYQGGYSGSDEECILAWVAELTKQPSIRTDGRWPESLRDGVALCELANALRPGSVAQINRSTMPFPQRENVSFLCCPRLPATCAKRSACTIDTRLHLGGSRTRRG